MDFRAFIHELRQQRWDDHRYYHHSRVNQSLHLLSAISFLTSYVLLTISPSIAVLIGWLVAMWSRQIGHFFFEPKDYDKVNQATQEHKEEIKVGYNLRRKVVLLSIWALSPAVLYYKPDMFGMLEPHVDFEGYVGNLAILWLVLGVAGLLFRTIQLFLIKDPMTGLAWCAKILSDPFHDLNLYHKSPLFLLQGQLIDPMTHVVQDQDGLSENEADSGVETAAEWKPAT